MRPGSGRKACVCEGGGSGLVGVILKPCVSSESSVYAPIGAGCGVGQFEGPGVLAMGVKVWVWFGAGAAAGDGARG